LPRVGMIFSSNLLRSGAWGRNRALVWVLGLLLVAGIGWWQEKWLWEQYHWRMVMRPSVLTLEKEKAARPEAEFMECHIGCPTMVVIPAGKYMMGSPAGQGTADEQPAHEVTIARPFAAGKYEVSFAQWDACVDSGACPRVADGDWGRGDQPVINVSWDEAKQYARWLSRITGKAYRLLTEAEWEYAARAGNAALYSFGDDELELHQYGWYSANSESKPQPVGRKKANAFALHDMHGNVWEWVEDVWHANYEGAPTDGSPWLAQSAIRVARGGSWNYGPDNLRSASRDGFGAVSRISLIGFRVARTLAP
jgi:formylglycine-generating enzyme required for sulfatase activity